MRRAARWATAAVLAYASGIALAHVLVHRALSAHAGEED